MIRIVIVIGMIIAGALIAGVYGGLYDQLTYSISPEFFTKYRFEQTQYKFAASMPPRLGAACIGFINTWHVGLLIGSVLALAGLINKDRRHLLTFTTRAFFMTLGIAFVAALIGWSVGLLPMQEAPDSSLGIKDTNAFGTVVNMNNFSYAGAVIGMFVGIFYQLYKHKQIKARAAGVNGDIL